MSRKLLGGNLGPLLVIIGLALFFIGGGVLGLVSVDYWDHTFVKTYRGYDIYYFPGPGGLYGIDTLGTNPPGGTSGWVYYTNLASAEGAIDNWVDSPDFNLTITFAL